MSKTTKRKDKDKDKDTTPSHTSPHYEQLEKLLEDNFAEIQAVFLEGDPRHYEPDLRYQINLYQRSRLNPVDLKPVTGGHGPDPDEVAQKILQEMTDMYESERKENVDYAAKLDAHLNEKFKDIMFAYGEDRHERASVPGRRFKVVIQLAKETDEYKRCGHWVFAEGFGRDNQQAAKLARKMLLLKEEKGLLWINEATDEKLLGHKVNFFEKKELNKLYEKMSKANAQIPNCLKSGERIEPERNTSTLSLQKLWNHSPLGSPIKEKKSFIESDSSGTSNTVTPRHSVMNLLSKSRRVSRDGSQSSSLTSHPIKKPEVGESTKDSAKTGKDKAAATKSVKSDKVEKQEDGKRREKTQSRKVTGQQSSSSPDLKQGRR